MRTGTRASYEERILRVQMYIQRHLDASLALEELSKIACFSPYHFHRVFQGMVGESLQEYIRRLRLERAAQALCYADTSVTQLAFAAGYETHESFTRAFRKQFGASPKQYRNQCMYRAQNNVKQPVQRYVTIIQQMGALDMEARVEEFKPMNVAFIRHVGPYAECHSAWEKLCGHPAVAQTFGPDTLCIGLCYDDPDVTEADKIRLDVCVTVPADFQPGDGINVQQIEGGKYAVLTHRGSYDGLHDCYRWLYGTWLPDSGYETKGSHSMEIYRNNPDETPEEDCLTDICVPLA